MKKLILALFAVLSIFSLTSCETYAQAAVYDEGIVYEYSYNNYPVRYIDGIAYYYCLYNNIWTWIILDRLYYDRIIHHPRPLRYIRPHYYGGRYHTHTHSPHHMAPRPDRISPQARPDRGGVFNRPGNRSIRPSGGGFGSRPGVGQGHGHRSGGRH